jgi:hypothetical protein
MAELPRETAKIVSADSANAADAVAAAVALNSAGAPLIVGSVAKASPKSAGAATAAALGAQLKSSADAASQTRQIAAITKAAVSAAPYEVAEIVSESCKVRPASFYTIGVTAAAGAPRSSEEKIIPAIISGAPALKPLVERARADFKTANRSASLALLLKHAESLLATLSREQNISADAFLAKESDSTIATKLTSLASAPPQQQPPFVPTGPTTELTPAGTEVLPGGRNYSGP